MLEWSRCHTLDRNNMRAQYDCNDATPAKLQEAVEKIFEFSNWPYMHNDETADCYKTISLNSWKNINEDHAVRIVAVMGSALVASLALYI